MVRTKSVKIVPSSTILSAGLEGTWKGNFPSISMTQTRSCVEWGNRSMVVMGGGGGKRENKTSGGRGRTNPMQV